MLEKLSDVQSRDLEIDALEAERKDTPPELIEIQRKKRELVEHLARRRREYEELRSQVNTNELELKALAERRRNAAEAALRASTSKEASQFQNQELQFSTRLQELEEDTLPLMERLEELENAVRDLEAEIAALEPDLAAMEQQERDRLDNIDSRIAAIHAEREQIAVEIDRVLLRQYEQVRKARRGLGLAEIVGNDRCGGCSVKLPIHVVQKARRGAGVTRCPSCGRILWLKDAAATKAGK